MENAAGRLAEAVWIDLLSPTPEEAAEVNRQIGVEIPTRAEMEEIEISSRLYLDDGAAFMTAVLPAHADTDSPEMAPVTFVLAGERLVTVRHHEPRAFATFPQHAEKVALGCIDGESVLLALLEAVVDRLADILELAGRSVDRLSQRVFKRSDSRPTRTKEFQEVLEEIGRKGDLTTHIRESLVAMERMIGFLNQVATQRKSHKDTRARLKTIWRDTHSLTDHATFLAQKITFLLDALLGMIGIEQSGIIKIFSVVAVVFLPPTLIASIYGMNFEIMPELSWEWGYPLSLLLMVLAAVLPYLYFKRRGWL